jgi:CRP-like cAMP-binding protein
MNNETIHPDIFASQLWKDILPDERISLLDCLGAARASYGKKSIIWSSGDPVTRFGIILSGEIRILMEDLEGRLNCLAYLHAPELFGEVFALAGSLSPVTVFSEIGAEVLFLDIHRVTTICSKSCGYHRQFVWNLLQQVAKKNVALSQKIQCVGQRTTKDKIASFLSMEHTRSGTNPFQIPFNRSEMADYLCVDRSALSLVLSQMQEDGLITYHKNEFRLLHLHENRLT